MKRFHLSRGTRAFTLVELLVASVVLLIILLMLVAMVNQTATIWRTTTTKVEQFRSARTAFESITRQLSQATINPYYDYSLNKGGYKIKYIRQSDLRFIAGACNGLYVQPTDANGRIPIAGPGHAFFFQAPIGFVSDDPETINPVQDPSNRNKTEYLYTGMDSLLNTWGYFIEYGSDYNYRPAFLNNSTNSFQSPPERYRYRLLEFMVPSDRIDIYKYTSNQNNSAYTTHEWFTDFLSLPANPPTSSSGGAGTTTTPTRPAHLLAENIITLVVTPQLSAADQASLPAGYSLAPSYSYDSTQSNPLLANSPNDKYALETDPKNQLPPVVQVTMVAMDETSATRQAALAVNNQPPANLDQILRSVFQTSPTSDAQSGVTAKNYNADLNTLQYGEADGKLSADKTAGLINNHIAYRIFTTNVSLRAAKWSRD